MMQQKIVRQPSLTELVQSSSVATHYKCTCCNVLDVQQKPDLIFILCPDDQLLFITLIWSVIIYKSLIYWALLMYSVRTMYFLVLQCHLARKICLFFSNKV
jgi:hypothetical protein